MTNQKATFVMRGYVGDLVFYFDEKGRALGLDLYREWIAGMGPEIKPGHSVGCCCENGSVMLKCPIHAVDLGDDFEAF